jgi:hypothetical protein
MKVKPLMSIALVASVSIGSVGSVFSVSAQGSAPPLAPSRLQRNASAGSSSNSASVSSFNGSVLNGSVVNNSTIGGASRLLRPATPSSLSSSPISAPNPVSSFAPISSSSQAGNSASLFSAAEQAAFSQVRQPPPLQQASPAIVAPGSVSSSAALQASDSSSRSSNQSKFDIGQALRLGAQVVNAINASSNNRPSNTGQFSSSATASPSAVLKNTLAKPAFVSKFARPLTASELTVLSKYDVVIVLDKSGSMDERDCPGGMSRWDWCRDQMMSLTAQIGSVFKNGITVALYSSDFDIFRNVDLGYVTRIFGENGPSGGTYTGKVMEAVFDDYFARRANNPATRKLLVQVVTDGDPSDKGALIAAISRASQMINSPGEITVNFLQIGHEEAGARTLAKLDSNMASEGAKFDIVRVEPFAAVEREGLPRALADAIN